MTTYNFTIKAIGIGTDGSLAGHVWVSVQPADGGAPAQSFGFYPNGMRQDDDAVHSNPDFSYTWQLTQEQKDRLDQFILDYVAYKEYLFPLIPIEVCVDFAVAAARAAGVDIREHGDGPLLPVGNQGQTTIFCGKLTSPPAHGVLPCPAALACPSPVSPGTSFSVATTARSAFTQKTTTSSTCIT